MCAVLGDAVSTSTAESTTLRLTLTRIVWPRTDADVQRARGRIIAEARQNGRVYSVVGDMHDPQLGGEYEFTGTLDYNDRFKRTELRFVTYRSILPETADGIRRYLIDVVKWVGPATARAIVERFGEQTLEVIRTQPEQLYTIDGLTPARVQEMQASLAENAAQEAAMIELNQLIGGTLGQAAVRKALKRWGSDAPHLIRDNPFILTDIHGVGWKTADAVHRRLGRTPDDLNRHFACVVHVLAELASRDGHTRVTRHQVAGLARGLLGQDLRPDLWDLATDLGAMVPLAEGQGLCAADLIDAETRVADGLTLLGTQNAPDDRAYPAIEREGLGTDQLAAVAALERAPVFVLTGAPGTGKTYTTARIVRALVGAGCEVALAAPTGKAAKQMSLALAEVCPRYARTIHSLLAPTVDDETGEFCFGHDETNPLDADVVIVDEFSMVDVRLARSLLRAIRPTSRLIMVGDHYQLPSVGPGAVLRDVLAAGVPSYELREIKRNAGRIVHACHALKDGRCPTPAAKLDLEAGENWRHIEADAEGAKQVIAALLAEKLPEQGFDQRWAIQLISPVNDKYALACDALNELARGIINGAAPRDKELGFGLGDKVVRQKNADVDGYLVGSREDDDADFDAGGGTVRIVNGDIGIVTDIDDKQITVAFRFPDRIVHLKRREHHLRLAYCLTGHKMQGSEVEAVILPLDRGMARLPLLTREWIYTAFSRAKKVLITVGDLSVLKAALRRVGTQQRQTNLTALLAARGVGR